jgi:tetratricopeptide (TPR) repeat protein
MLHKRVFNIITHYNNKRRYIMKLILRFILLAALFTAAGCISWEEGWKTKVQATAQGNVKQLLADAAILEASADTPDKIKNLITAYEKITAIEPANFEALSKLSEYLFMYSYIFTADKNAREGYYLKAIKTSEQAMYTNPEFRKLADQDKPVWEAVSALTEREMAPMYWWYMSAGQYWTDQNVLKRLLNFYWSSRAKTILERMTAVKPDWNYGRIHMAWACFYAIVPGFSGGDLKKSAEYFDQAIQLGPDVITHYVNRAKYLHVKNGDKESFRKDLNFAISRDLKKISYPYPWGAGYQMKARDLLSKIDTMF